MAGAKASLCFLFVQVALLLMHSPVHPAHAGQGAVYIGSEACGECHPDQYESYKDNSKKADSFTGIKKMAAKLTPAELGECYGCHTTGYGKPGGFRSEQETPQLKNIGCEACHGPGSLHADSQDPSDLNAQLGIEDCKTCHNAERVAAFNFKPLVYGGAH
ncbi:MAG: cytochrome c family protein [Desulfosarcinaceae bacterium]|jgi:hypothetical protein